LARSAAGSEDAGGKLGKHDKAGQIPLPRPIKGPATTNGKARDSFPIGLPMHSGNDATVATEKSTRPPPSSPDPWTAVIAT